MSGCNCSPADQVASPAYLTRHRPQIQGQNFSLHNITRQFCWKAFWLKPTVLRRWAVSHQSSDKRHNFIICWTGTQREHLLATARQLQWIWRARCVISLTASLYIRFRRADAGRKTACDLQWRNLPSLRSVWPGVFLAAHKGITEIHLFLQKSFLGYSRCYLLILPLLPALAVSKSPSLTHS